MPEESGTRKLETHVCVNQVLTSGVVDFSLSFWDLKFRDKLATDDRVVGLSMLDQGVWAEVKVGGEHLKLFSEQNALGVQASVYNLNAKNWVAPSEAVDDIEQGKDRAATHATEFLRRVANSELPPLKWKNSRSV